MLKFVWPNQRPLVGSLQPDVRPLSQGRYKLYGPYAVYVREDEGEAVWFLTVPDCFEYDGASIPRALWSVAGLRPDGLLRAAALTHDFLYRTKGKIAAERLNFGLVPIEATREEADGIFLDMMLAAGVTPWRAKAAHKAVRWFGPRW